MWKFISTCYNIKYHATVILFKLKNRFQNSYCLKQGNRSIVLIANPPNLEALI
ncbi:MAG: hypothetical protein QW803_05965 [Candidatus Methanomethylicia archaeon]